MLRVIERAGLGMSDAKGNREDWFRYELLALFAWLMSLFLYLL